MIRSELFLVIYLCMSLVAACGESSNPDPGPDPEPEPLDVWVVVQENNQPCPLSGCIMCADGEEQYSFDLSRECSRFPASVSICAPHDLCQAQLDAIEGDIIACTVEGNEYSLEVDAECAEPE